MENVYLAEATKAMDYRVDRNIRLKSISSKFKSLTIFAFIIH